MKLLIVDDEPLARSALLHLCRDAQVQVVGEAQSGIAAVGAIRQWRPDVLLLDVGLPDMSGFDVLRIARDEHRLLAIMVTAHTEHAAAAFVAGAVDYLLKPVDAARFAQSIERARARLELPEPRDGVEVPDIRRRMEAEHRIIVGERNHRLYPLDPQTIEYVESDGNYVTFRTTDADYISRDSIKRLADVLAGCGFVRIERSLLLNLRMIAFAEPAGHGTFAFTLRSGTVLQSSATYRQEIIRAIPLGKTVRSTVTLSSRSCP